jgi:hypothetical protein
MLLYLCSVLCWVHYWLCIHMGLSSSSAGAYAVQYSPATVRSRG